LKNSELAKSRARIEQTLLNHWEDLPPIFITSAIKKSGRDKVLEFIQTAIDSQKND
jgi:GTP-binding protein